jgi:hypothetical protein
MALQKSITSESGVTTEYWKLRNVKNEYSYTEPVKIILTIDGYVNYQIRDENYQPTTRKVFIVENPETWTVMCGTDGKNNTSNNPYKIAYEWIKANSGEFTGAIDV